MKQVASKLFIPVLLLSLLVAVGCSTPTATEPAAPVATDGVAAPAPTVAATETAATAPTEAPTSAATTASPASTSGALAFNNAAWNYDADNDVYWQIGVQYCTTPATTEYETLGIYVPGAYMTATANGDGTYTATLNADGTINGFTAQTAPVVMPVNTPGYSAQAAPTAYSYDEVSSYMQAGFIYVAAGMRGRANGYDASGNLTYSGGAPWGVTDFKAAVRYLRYNKEVLPGNSDGIFAFGMSGGGAQTAIIGASGDSDLYTPYLEAIGAAMTDAQGQPLSDAVTGAMAWCPITSLDYADAAYEWNMGQFAATGTRAEGTFTAALSADLAQAYADYINQLGLQDENGHALVLTATDSGVYTAGSYYDYLVSTVETSLNNFLLDTTFPYTPTISGFPGGGMRPGGGTSPQGGTPPQGGMPPAGALPGGMDPSSFGSATTYATVEDYIASLNESSEWVVYDAATNTAQVSSLAGFVNSQKTPTKTVGAFDALDRSAAENDVFGNDESDALHFDPTLAGLLAANQATYAAYSDWNAAYVEAYATDLTALDKLGSSIATRMDAYNPMYYLLPYYKGYQTATVAPYWRINTGIQQGDTANTVEMNLALALNMYPSVNDVEFTTVWGQGHTKAERTGSSDANFIAWVTGLMQQ